MNNRAGRRFQARVPSGPAATALTSGSHFKTQVAWRGSEKATDLTHLGLVATS